MYKRIGILLFLFCLMSSTVLYGSPVVSDKSSSILSETTDASDKVLFLSKNIEIKEVNDDSNETIFVFLDKESGVELLREDSFDYDLFISQLKESVRSDAKKGLENLTNVTTTLDYIRLDTWGYFLNNYYGKNLTNFVSGPISIKFDNYDFDIINSEVSRRYVKEKLLPEILSTIEEESKNYPVKRYALDITSGTSLKDYECDLTSVREVKTVYPLDGLEDYVFYNTGAFYGMTLSSEYVQIMKGYLEGDKSGYDRPVEGEYPGCVNVLSYITLLRNVSNGTLSDKKLSDFMIYNNLAIVLDTKQLVDTSDMTTDGSGILFSDYKLDPEKLVLAPISNDVVIIQPTYLACAYYNNLNRGLYRTVDTMRFLTNGDDTFDLIDSNGNVVPVPMSDFMDDNGYLGTQLGSAPFLMYYTSRVPYELLIDWVYNYASSEGFDQSVIDSTKDLIKKEMKELGQSKEYNAYLKAAGQTTETMKSFIFIFLGVLFLLVLVVCIFVIKKKLKNSSILTESEAQNSLLFNDELDDYNDDDDGGFELH